MIVQNVDNYKVFRLSEVPEVHIVDSEEKATDAGEVGVPRVAPALANAVYCCFWYANPPSHYVT